MRAYAALAAVLTSVAVTSCAPAMAPVETQVIDDIRTGTGASPRFGAPAPGVPPGVRLEDGLSREDAVAVALWNNAAFQVHVTELGFARADLVEAGMISNPVLALLLPVGPKQLEAAVRWPLEMLWERPRRVEAATHALESSAHGLVQTGLDLALAVRVAFADLALATDRQTLAEESAATLERIDKFTQSRLAAGDIAELDARAARVDATRSVQEVERAGHDVTVARERLRLLLGLTAEDGALSKLERTEGPEKCGTTRELLIRALAARPDVRAAELAIDAAAARLGWEESKVLQFTAVLDANGQRPGGFEWGPGLEVFIPIFSRNQGPQLRAETELTRASAFYVQLQQQVGLDLREAMAQFEQASQSRVTWSSRIVAPLQANVADAEKLFAAGESTYLVVLENARRLIDARLRAQEFAADRERARARVERAAGMACPVPGGTS